LKQPIFVFGGIRITRRRSDNCDLLRGKNTLAESVLAVTLFKPPTTLDCKADKKTKAVKTKDGCKDTRMLSVRRREATGGDLVAGSMLWTLETGVARGGGSGGGIAAVENGPTLAMP
jgi:hypothetical protein